jgi:hypothetical protein
VGVTTEAASAPAADTAAPDPGEEVRLAMIPEAPLAAPREPDVRDLTYDLETLPMTFAGGWVLDRRRDALDGATRCLLFSRELTMFDGYDQTKVRLQVSLDGVLVRTDSNLDRSYPDQGLRVDGGALVPFVLEVPDERSAYAKQSAQLAMAGGERLTLALGFWPTWPVTRTQTATLSLAGFDIAFAALRACSEQN